MPEERLPKLIMEWIPAEMKKKGRPKKTWIEGVQSAMIARGLETDQWMDRGMSFGFPSSNMGK